MKQPFQRDSREGVALVIVLGFVAVLAILAVSLMITTRIERLSTTSFAEVTRARQLVNVALARAMDDIDYEMVKDGLVYPASNVYYLTSGSGVIRTNLYSNGALAYVPAWETSSLPRTIYLDDVRVGTNVIGRVGYVAVDCSGLVDVNLASMKSRASGRDGREVQLSPSILTEITELGLFLDRRSNEWSRVESLAELYYLGVGTDASKRVIESNRPPANVFTYSRFGLDHNPMGEPKVSLAGDWNDLLARRTNIIGTLELCGVPNAVMVFSNLLDYVDTDSIPRDIESFCTEAVPMINEIIFRNSLTVQPDPNGIDTQYIYDVFMDVETWFPFPDRSFANAKLRFASPVVKFAPANALLAPLVPDAASDMVAPGAGSDSIGITNHLPDSFNITTFQWRKIATNAFLQSGTMMGLRVEFDGDLFVEDGAGNSVDRVRPDGSASLIAYRSTPQQNRRVSFSVKDPRFNHQKQWQMESSPSAGTPGKMNAGIQNEGEKPSSMYVRDYPLNEPKLDMGLGGVGDLGFLSVGAPWRTIALYNTPGTNLNPVLDYFTLETNAIRRGLVNVNSLSQPALASAFYAAAVEAYPGGGGPTVTVNGAVLLASNLIQRVAAFARPETNRGVSVIGDFDHGLVGQLNNVLTSPALTNDAQIEAVIRNSAGLFSYRQNLFTIFLYGQAIAPAGVTGAEQRAVAVVWRDPEFNDSSNQTNKMMVRFFRWLQ